MKIFECKCGSKEVFIKESSNNKGLYCSDCGKWIQWLGKDDLRLAQRQISIISSVPRNLDELKEHDKQIRADERNNVLSTLSKLIESDYNSKECKLLLADLCEMLLEEIKEQNK